MNTTPQGTPVNQYNPQNVNPSYSAAPPYAAPPAPSFPQQSGAPAPTGKKSNPIKMVALIILISLLINVGGIFIYHSIMSKTEDKMLVVQVYAAPPAPWSLIVNQVYPATANFQCSDGTWVWAGSGIVISPDGYILTNDHVAGDKGMKSMDVTLQDGRKFKATLVATDPANDVALVKIDATDLVYARLGNSDTVQVGDAIITMGNPLGEYPNTVSSGIISNVDRYDSYSGRQKQKLFQATEPTTGGNSGGGVLNSRGEVIAIHCAGVSGWVNSDGVTVTTPQNITFCVPVNFAIALIQNNASDVNIPDTPSLGIVGMEVTDKQAKKSTLFPKAGVYIERVEDFGAAYFGGLLANDRILRINKKAVNSVADIDANIKSVEIGEAVEVEVVRGGVIFVYRIPVMRKY